MFHTNSVSYLVWSHFNISVTKGTMEIPPIIISYFYHLVNMITLGKARVITQGSFFFIIKYPQRQSEFG